MPQVGTPPPLGDREMVPKAHMPSNTSKHRQWVVINGQKVEALRYTGASMNTVRCHLADNHESPYSVALVPFEWGWFQVF